MIFIKINKIKHTFQPGMYLQPNILYLNLKYIN